MEEETLILCRRLLQKIQAAKYRERFRFWVWKSVIVTEVFKFFHPLQANVTYSLSL
jgi:hypothetical protein